MARLCLLFSLARRRCLHNPHPSHPRSHISSLLRPFSSAAEPIKPVSYPAKPKNPDEESSEAATSSSSADPSSRRPSIQRPGERRPPQETASSGGGSAPRPWTREDARFVKDVPSISPVSYPSRVAPLPEDRPAAADSEKEATADGQLQKEAKRIQSESGVRSFLNVQEEEKVPFPTIIPLVKTPTKSPMDLLEAIRQVKANAKRKFLETVEAHVNLGVDPRRGDQMVRGALTLPHGTGKTVRVAVFAEGDAADEAREAGADIVGGDELIETIRIGGGKLNFDKCIATPMFMPRLTKIARILGPRGLMPNPKLGSVTSDVSVAVKEAKCGRVNFKIDKTAIVHVGLGKVDFSEESLRENIGAFVHALLLAKPVGLKKTSKYAGYVKNFTLSSTMGPGFPVSIQTLSMAADHYNKLRGK